MQDVYSKFDSSTNVTPIGNLLLDVIDKMLYQPLQMLFSETNPYSTQVKSHWFFNLTALTNRKTAYLCRRA